MTDTKCIGWVQLSGQQYIVLVSPFTDGTAAEITVRDLSGNLVNMRDKFVGQVLEAFELTVGTPSDLDLIQFLDDAGGIVAEWGGAINAALGQVPQSAAYGLRLPITKGCAFKGTTSD